MNMFNIGPVKVKTPVVLAPLAGITCSPFRRMAKGYGASLVYSEMICANGIFYNNRNTHRLSYFEDVERPIALQIFGDVPKNMAVAARYVEEAGADILDINLGCPQAKIAKKGKGSGAALMQRPRVLKSVMKAVLGATNLPVTAKLRSGWSRVNALEVAKELADMGVAAVAVHPRLGVQRFSGKSDWRVIAKVRDAVDVPILGSGDLFTPVDCKKMMEETHCDAVMMARGIRGAPWNITRAIDLINGKEPTPPPSLETRLRVLRDLAGDMLDYFETTSQRYKISNEDNLGKTMRDMRKFVHWFFKGCPKWLLERDGLLKLKTLEELDEFLENATITYNQYTGPRK